MWFQTTWNFHPFYQVFVCDVFSKESIIFISFHKKVWRYDHVITISWQNQGIIIVYCIFLKCLNKVSWEILYTTKINKFWKKKKKKEILLVSCPLIVVLEQHYHISQKNDVSQKSLFGLLNHLWYKPESIKWFFSMNSFG